MVRELTPSESDRFAKSVSNIEVTLYPDAYTQDKKMFDIVELYATLVVHNIDKYTDYTFNISVNEFLVLVDEQIGVKKCIKEFKSKFNYDSLRNEFDKLIDNYSSVELIWLYDVFPNLSYIKFHIVRGLDNRGGRPSKATVLNLPDISINSISLNLRELYPQEIVDKINLYAIESDVINDNVMNRDVAMSFDTVGEMFKTFSEFAIEQQDEELYHALYNPIAIYDISELVNDTGVVIITDYSTI